MREDFIRKTMNSFYLEAGCGILAIALHHGLGWQMVALMKGEIVRHILVRSPEGIYWDARGEVAESEVGTPFDLEAPHQFREITESEIILLSGKNAFADKDVEEAFHLADVIWPELPWKKGKRLKLLSFLNDLERISREHGVWIRPTDSTALPHLVEADGSETGYEIRPTMDGHGYTLNRIIGLTAQK